MPEKRPPDVAHRLSRERDRALARCARRGSARGSRARSARPRPRQIELRDSHHDSVDGSRRPKVKLRHTLDECSRLGFEHPSQCTRPGSAATSTSGATRSASSRTPRPASRPCGGPNSTRRAPASSTLAPARRPLRGAGEGEPVERPRRGSARPPRRRARPGQRREAGEQLGVEVGRRVERRRRPARYSATSPARARARARAILVDHRDGAEHDPDAPARAEPLAASSRDHGRVRGPADLELVGVARRRTRRVRGPQAPISSGTRGRRGAYSQSAARRAARSAGRRSPSGRRRAAGARPPRPRASPSAAGPARSRARRARRRARGPGSARPSRASSSSADLPRDLDRVQREGVQARRPEPHAARRPRDLQQRRERRLEPEVVEHADRREPGLLDGRGELAVLAGGLSLCRPRPSSRSRQVVRRERAARDALDAHDQALVGIGAADERVLLEPVPGRRARAASPAAAAARPAARRGRSGRPSGMRSRLDSVSSK